MINPTQQQILWKILFLIAASGKNQRFDPQQNKQMYVPGTTYTDAQSVSTADIKRAKKNFTGSRTAFSGSHKDIVNLYQHAPSRKHFTIEDPDFIKASKNFLSELIGAWCADLPAWWYDLYLMGLGIKITPSSWAEIKFYSSKFVFNKIVDVVSQKNTNLLVSIGFGSGNQLTLIETLLQIAIPPHLLATLVVNETDPKIKNRCMREILCFLRKRSTLMLSTQHKYQNQFFGDVSFWLDSFLEATTFPCVFQSEVSDKYAEEIALNKLSELSNRLMVAISAKQKDETIDSFLAIKASYNQLPERLQSIKYYLAPLAQHRKFYLPLFQTNELKSDFRWYLERIIFFFPDSTDDGFVVGGLLNFINKQLAKGNVHYITKIIDCVPDWIQPLVCYGLLQKALVEPQQWIKLAKYYSERQDFRGLKDWFEQFAVISGIYEQGNTLLLGHENKPVLLEEFTHFLDLTYTHQESETITHLSKGYAYFQHHQVAGILWFTWVQAMMGHEKLMATSKLLDNETMREWFKERALYQENPKQTKLMDEALALKRFFSPELIVRIHHGEISKATAAIKTIKQSLPKIPEHIAGQIIAICPSFAMAKMIMKELVGGKSDDYLSIRILIHAIDINNVNVLESYAKTHDQTSRRRHFNDVFFFGVVKILYKTVNGIDNIKTYQLPKAYQVLSDMLINRGLRNEELKTSIETELFQLLSAYSSSKNKLFERLFEHWFYLMRGRLKLLSAEKQNYFKQNDLSLTLQELNNYFQIIHRFLDVSELELGLCSKLPMISQTWCDIDRQDKTAVRRFLFLLVDFINGINDIARLSIFSVLIRGLFYQIHSRGFSSDTAIIDRLQNKELRRSFVSAHLVRLAYLGEIKTIRKLQLHFRSLINYSIDVEVTFTERNDAQKIFFPLEITCEGDFRFPCQTIDTMSINLEIIVETGEKFFSSEARELISDSLRKKIDSYGEVGANYVKSLQESQEGLRFSLLHLLINESDLPSIQLAFENFNLDENLEGNKYLLGGALLRYKKASTPAEKRNTSKIIEFLFQMGIGDHLFDREADEKLSELAYKTILINFIKAFDIELYALLYDALAPQTSGSIQKPIDVLAENLHESKLELQSETIDPAFEEMVKTIYEKYEAEANTKTVSARRMFSIIKNTGLTLKNEIEKFIQGYLSKPEDLSGLDTIGIYAKPYDAFQDKTVLLNASYFDGEQFVKNTDHFYPIRKSQVISYLYFNPEEIQDLEDPEPFHSIYQKPVFVGKYGSGLKYLSDLKVNAEGHEIKGCYQMKIHDSKPRILCYLAPSDHPDNPNIYIACRYFKDGFHGRIDPNQTFEVSKPNWSLSAASNSKLEVRKMVSKNC